MNKLIHGDCLEKMHEIPDNTIDMIYLDPPFYTQRKQSLVKKNEDTGKLNVYSFDDSWNDLSEYINFMEQRLKECKRVLKETGTIFLHCDRNACHYLKISMDKIFGEMNFRSEIIWSYKRWSNAKKGLLNSHQNIYFYSKSNDFKFNTLYTEYSPTTNVDQILQNRKKDENGVTIYQTDDLGEVVNNYNKKGVPLSDVWDIPYLNPKAKERNGYPTQKPILLLEQIIKISTDENDTVLDPFCGSGTTLAAAKLLNRNYIGIDTSDDAISLCAGRLKDVIKTESRLIKKGIEAYIEKSATELQILKFLNAKVIQRNSGLDGIIASSNTKNVIGIKIQKEHESLEEAIMKLNSACKSKGIERKVLIKNDNQSITSLFEQEVIKRNNDIKIINSYKEILNELVFGC